MDTPCPWPGHRPVRRLALGPRAHRHPAHRAHHEVRPCCRPVHRGDRHGHRPVRRHPGARRGRARRPCCRGYPGPGGRRRSRCGAPPSRGPFRAAPWRSPRPGTRRAWPRSLASARLPCQLMALDERVQRRRGGHRESIHILEGRDQTISTSPCFILASCSCLSSASVMPVLSDLASLPPPDPGGAARKGLSMTLVMSSCQGQLPYL